MPTLISPPWFGNATRQCDVPLTVLYHLAVDGGPSANNSSACESTAMHHFLQSLRAMLRVTGRYCAVNSNGPRDSCNCEGTHLHPMLIEGCHALPARGWTAITLLPCRQCTETCYCKRDTKDSDQKAQHASDEDVTTLTETHCRTHCVL